MASLLISIVIPAYNYASTLPRAVKSVLDQLDEAPAELLVIDDGSTDATAAVIEQLHLEYPGRFRSIRKPNGGLASVRNRGIEETRGAFLVFLDADDEMAPGALSTWAGHIATQPQTRLIIGGYWSVFEDGRRTMSNIKPLPANPRQRVRGYLLDKTISIANGACAMHREVFARGAYPERFRNAEDIPVFAQILAGYPCTTVDQPLALIHKHSTSLRHNLDHARAIGLSIVDEVFSPARMPAELQDLKQAYRAQRCLSLFRTFYNAGERQVACEYYWRAFKADWRAISRWSYTRKALSLWLRERR